MAVIMLYLFLTVLCDGLQCVIVPFLGHSKKGGKDQESIRSYPLLNIVHNGIMATSYTNANSFTQKDYILSILSLKFFQRIVYVCPFLFGK